MQSIPDMAALIKLAQSPAGQQLLNLLQSDPSVNLDSITAAAASGNLEKAKQQLSHALSSKEAKELMKQLENQT